MDEINRLRRNQLAIFGCGRNAGDPKRIQCQKFIVSERIKENRAAKSRVETITDIGLEKLSELGLVWPALVPVPGEVLRVSEYFGDWNGRYNGSGHHSHDRRRRSRLSRREPAESALKFLVWVRARESRGGFKICAHPPLSIPILHAQRPPNAIALW